MNERLLVLAWDKANKRMIEHKHIGVLLKNACKPGGQFIYCLSTGQKDDNKKMMHDGHIVIQFKGKDEEEIYVIKWNQDKCGYWLWLEDAQKFTVGLNAFQKGLEIIGHIYSDPQFLQPREAPEEETQDVKMVTPPKKLKQYKTCNGCKARGFRKRSHGKRKQAIKYVCEFGYGTKETLSGDSLNPLEPCSKPRTVKEHDDMEKTKLNKNYGGK